MGVIYRCTYVNCSFPGETQFETRFNSESIMDSNNLAIMFCPFCKKQMEPSRVSDKFQHPDNGSDRNHMAHGA